MLRVPYPIYVGAGTSAEPVNQSYPLRTICYGTHSGEAVKTQKSTLDLLGPLITSKTRLKLLLRFFLNQNLSGYLQGLSKELDENTNSIRVELNRLEEAGLLSSELQGRRKLYRVNDSHPLTSDLTSIVRKVSGIDALVDKVVENLPGLSQVWICGALARGIQGDSIDCLLIGTDLNSKYIAGLSARVKELTGKKVNTQVLEQMPDEKREQCLQVWGKGAEQ
jgi:DNA-binding transcriptional ArsR family regulator